MTPKEELRRFLFLCSRAFELRDKDESNFRPDDKLLDICNQRYPTKGMPGALELELFSRLLKKQYGIEREDLWDPELTLGAL